jgi:radical SAM superfamily enzyme YgiQ (UPF0313 family)
MSKTIYLINPRCDVPTYYGAEVHAASGLAPAVLLADLALPTVAAMIPDDFKVLICEESVQKVDFEIQADFVGITGKINQQTRMIELAREFRRRGKIVLFGGPYASLSPNLLRPECDILVRGEIENIAAKLFSDLRAGTWEREYIGDKPDLRVSPLPRWDLYPNHRAVSGTLQTSRGCPFECEFCDVIQYLGRKQRHKSPPQVLTELDEMYRRGYRIVFLADDNFTVYRARARELLLALREWNDAQTEGRVSFSTQVSIDGARDPELLQLCSEAGLATVFVGIETPNEASLKETKKRQNMGIDLVERIERFLAHGIVVSGGMMVGFDSDTVEIFERQYEFAMSTPIPMFTVTPLSAPMATPLYTRMEQENRLFEAGAETAMGLPWITNIVPKQMSREELIAGVRWLCNRLYRPEAFGQRVLRFIDRFEVPAPRVNSAGRVSSVRTVDAERVQLSSRIMAMGAEERLMISRISKRLERKTGATPFVLMLIGYYMQIRHIYESCGIWDPALGAQPRPRLEARQDIPRLPPAAPVPPASFAIL